MASNNTTEQDILALFPDNFTNEISAADMRNYVNLLFNDREVKVVKVDTVVNLAANNADIYEGTLVTIWADYNQNRVGLYLSKVNQPTLITDLIQLSSITGEDVDGSINYTYDYQIELEVNNIPETYTNIVSLTTPNRESGVYEVGMSVNYNFDQNNKSLYMRWRANGGAWAEFTTPPSSAILDTPRYIIDVVEHTVGPMVFEVEMRKEDASGIFNVPKIALTFERKA